MALILTVTWNLMCRSKNTVNVRIEHMEWEGDVMTVKFAHTKKGQEKQAICMPILWFLKSGLWLGFSPHDGFPLKGISFIKRHFPKATKNRFGVFFITVFFFLAEARTYRGYLFYYKVRTYQIMKMLYLHIYFLLMLVTWHYWVMVNIESTKIP